MIKTIKSHIIIFFQIITISNAILFNCHIRLLPKNIFNIIFAFKNNYKKLNFEVNRWNEQFALL